MIEWIIIVVCILTIGYLLYVNRRQRRFFIPQIADLKSKLQSRSTTYGKISEQFAPFMEGYPFDPQRFRFIGSPIDGVQFEDDKVLFIEVKSGPQSKLSPEQNRIKYQIRNKRVEWYEFQIK